jgi:hypothetical protein
MAQMNAPACHPCKYAATGNGKNNALTIWLTGKGWTAFHALQQSHRNMQSHGLCAGMRASATAAA